MTTPLADVFGTSNSQRTKPLRDAFDDGDFNRPERIEDTVPRHGSNGTPKVWWPDNSRQSFYGRPSGWGKKGENTSNLERWKVRTTVSGYLDFGDQSKALRAERAALGPEDKAQHNALNEKALRLANVQDRLGTAVHALTERHDLGQSTVPGEYAPDLEAWKQITRHFKIVTMPSGRPGVEVFVALDYDITDPATGQVAINPDDGLPFRTVRLAGTFDRLVRYRPCSICGCRNYILDLKTGKIVFGQQTIAVQLGIYSGSKEYIPFADGGERHDLPDVCLHRGIVINLPAGTGVAQAVWVNIAWGYSKAVELIPRITSYQYKKDLILDFTPAPDVWLAVENASTPQEVRQLHAQYPGPHWTENDHALALFASKRINDLGGQSTPKWK